TLEADRGGVRRLAEGPLQPEVPAGDGLGGPAGGVPGPSAEADVELDRIVRGSVKPPSHDRHRFARHWLAMIRKHSNTVLAVGLALLALPGAVIADSPPRLLIVISVDGLGQAQLEACRPWFEAGFKRLLAEGRLEASCRYRHMNTETGPGH